MEKLISDDYKRLNEIQHNIKRNIKGRHPYGHTGNLWIPIIEWYISMYGRYDLEDRELIWKGSKIKSILDYGCGGGYFKYYVQKRIDRGCIEYKNIVINEYDPCIKEKSGQPKASDLILVADVLEHVEPEYLSDTLNYIYSLMNIIGFFVIHLDKGAGTLPDGSEGHRIIKLEQWWIDKLKEHLFISHKLDLTNPYHNCGLVCMVEKSYE